MSRKQKQATGILRKAHRQALGEPLERRRLLSVSFAAQQTYAVGHSPWSDAIADVNGDGKPDLIVANYADNTVGVLLGNGNGTFQAQTTYAVGSGPTALQVADLGNGHLDIVVTNYNDNDVGILLGNGNGTFQAETTVPVSGEPRGLAVADLNGDGKPDLIVANQFSNDVGVLLGNGDGTFQPQVTYATGTGPYSVAVANLGNGHPDIVTANAKANTVSVLLGAGDGTFAAQTAYTVGGKPFSVAVADLGNGHPDVLVANDTDGTLGVLLGHGDGTLAAQQVYRVGTSPVSLAIADFGNGNPDVVVDNQGDDDVGVLLGNGDGTLGAQQTFATGTNPLGVAVADLGNGHPDVVATNYADGQQSVSVLLGQGNDQLAFAQQPASTTAGTTLAAVKVDVETGTGSLLSSDTSTVTLAIATGPTGGTITGATTAAAIGGVATFSNLSFSTAGTYTLTATDSAATSVTSASFSITAPAANQLAFAQQPSAGTTAAALAPVKVDVDSAAGALLGSDTSTVTLAVASGPAGGTLTGTPSVAAVAGVATFTNLVFSVPGTYLLTATDGGDAAATSAAFSITSPTATPTLTFAVQPTTVAAGAVLPSIVVDVTDGSGNLLTTDVSTVTLALSSTAATLGGTTAVAAVGGVATFSNLTVSAAGTYTLTAGDGSDVPGTSSPFTVTPPPTAATITGSVFDDANGDGTLTAGETNLAGATVYLDVDGTGTLAAGDPSAVTGADGTYTITGLAAGSYTVRQVVPTGDLQTAPVLGAGVTVSVQPNGSATVPAFADQPGTTPLLPATSLSAALLTKPAARVLGGTTATFKLRVTNGAAGPLLAGTLALTLYLGPDATFTARTVLAGGGLGKSIDLPPGHTTTLTARVTYPSSLPTATYQLFAAVVPVTAAGAAVQQPVTAIASRAVFITRPTVDLVASLPASVKIRPGKATSVTVTVKNTGTATAVGTVTIQLYQSTTGTADSTTPKLNTVTKTVKIAAGRSAAVKVPFQASGTTPGTYQLVAVIAPTVLPVDTNAADDTAVAQTR